MKSRFNNHSFVSEQEDYENSPENSGDSPPSAPFGDTKITTSTSSSKARRAVQKRIVSIPIREVEGSRLKSETNSPPSDSWAWRKYGQKPIKGSPYPRGYYRCSSSKGCPARKQVERSRVDPSMLVVTYSCDHNHPWPPSRNNNNNNNNNNNIHNHTHPNTTPPGTVAPPPEPENTPIFTKQVEPQEEKFSNIEEDFSEFKWFSDLESCSSAMLESPLLEGEFDNEVGMIFSMREEDESLFADLGELPECSLVFRRGIMEREEERRPRCTFDALV